MIDRGKSLESIYSLYPRKVGRRKALQEIDRAITRLVSGKDGLDRMTEQEAVTGLLYATKKFHDSPAGQRGGYTPHPSTWFHQSRYLDDPEEWNNVPKPEGIAEQRVRENTDAFARVFSESPQSDGGTFQRALDRRRNQDLEGHTQLLLGIGSD